MKPRVVLVSHTYAAPINRAKLDALAQYVSLTAIIPARWQETLFAVDADARGNADQSYSLRALPIHFSGHTLRHIYPFRTIREIVRAVQPDLVYVEEEPASLSLAQFAWLKGDSKLVFFSWENILRRARLSVLEGWNMARCDGAICGNLGAMKVLRKKKFGKPIGVIPQLGIDPQVFSPARSQDVRSGLGLDGFVVGYVGRLVLEKGLWTLLGAVESLLDVRLVMIGSGPLRGELEQWISSRNLTERIRIIAAVPHRDVPLYLNAIDAFVLPSRTIPRWKEQFGHVLIEAMACGVPVIGSDSGAIPEVIADAGIIFHEGDVRALRQAIVSLKMDPARCIKFAQQGRERVLEHCTHERIATQNAEFFQQVLSQ